MAPSSLKVAPGSYKIPVNREPLLRKSGYRFLTSYFFPWFILHDIYRGMWCDCSTSIRYLLQSIILSHTIGLLHMTAAYTTQHHYTATIVIMHNAHHTVNNVEYEMDLRRYNLMHKAMKKKRSMSQTPARIAMCPPISA